MKFKRKPDTTTIDAVQWFPDVVLPMVQIEPATDMPIRSGGTMPMPARPYVVTAQQQRAYLTPGDWIITEPNGVDHYPCKPDIFEQRYERAE
jgi:hypothetical protein